MDEQPIDLHARRIGAVLNTASGSCTSEHADEMAALFAEHGLTLARMWCGASDALPEAFEQVRKHEIDVLVVLGGDGTIRSAAELCSNSGALLVPLPGGTMNILPRALYGGGTWQEILRRILTKPAIRPVSGGTVAGRHFFIAAVCGAPALWTHVREALRAGALDKALEHGKVAMEHMFSSKTRYHFNEMHEGEAEAIMVTCPLVSDALESDREVFEAAVIDVNHAGEVLELATAAAFGSWRDTQHVAIVRTDTVTVSSDRPIPVIVDGEPIDVGQEATFAFLPHAFSVLTAAE